MEQATAQLNTYRQSPRKVRVVANAIRGKSVTQALATLKIVNKTAAAPLRKLLDSALANAKNQGMNTNSLIIKEITVDGGQILYRRLAMSRGRAYPMRKRTSHVKVVLAENNKKPKAKKAKE